MRYNIKLVLMLIILLFPFYSSASICPNIDVCFTPGQDCTQQIVDTINQAKRSILVQAYEFTSEPIVESIIHAKDLGVDVEVILDKTQIKQKSSIKVVEELLAHAIPIWIDHKPAIAHNKIIIVDNQKVITGSFNFTEAAQKRNTENLLIIDNDSDLVDKYIENWYNREKQSTPYQCDTNINYEDNE